MPADDIAIRASHLSKVYRMYERPFDRLRQWLAPNGKKYYREFAALDDVSFEIRKGETVGIIGRNGSGKSTLLQLICGIRKPTSGTVTVNGRISALLELGAGFHPEFTGRENVFLQGAIQGLSREEMEARFDDIAAFADIGEFIEQPVKTYSSGMFVRLAFAAAAHVLPDILVVDEALSVGDMAFQRKCTRLMEKLRNEGTTIFLVSHNLHLIERFSNRVLALECGRLKCDALALETVLFYRDLIRQCEEKDPVTTINKIETHYSMREVELLDVLFVDQQNSMRECFATGEDIIVILRYSVLKPIRNVFFGCSIWADPATRIGQASMAFDQKEPYSEELEGEFEVTMTLPRTPLLPGKYWLRGGVYDANLHYAYCLWGWTGKSQGMFTITGTSVNGFALKDELGYVIFPSKWKVLEKKM